MCVSVVVDPLSFLAWLQKATKPRFCTCYFGFVCLRQLFVINIPSFLVQVLFSTQFCLSVPVQSIAWKDSSLWDDLLCVKWDEELFTQRSVNQLRFLVVAHSTFQCNMQSFVYCSSTNRYSYIMQFCLVLVFCCCIYSKGTLCVF